MDYFTVPIICAILLAIAAIIFGFLRLKESPFYPVHADGEDEQRYDPSVDKPVDDTAVAEIMRTDQSTERSLLCFRENQPADLVTRVISEIRADQQIKESARLAAEMTFQTPDSLRPRPRK